MTIKNKNIGFSLIELLIVLSIICILAAISYPIYKNQIIKTRRYNAIIELIDLSGRLEQYYNENHTYENATLNNLHANNKNKFYELNIKKATEKIYSIQAIPKKNKDTKCGTLSIDQLGNKSISGAGTINDCFP